MSRSCSIRTFEDITESSLKSLLQSLHGREDVSVTDVGPFDGTGLVNAGFQSDIKKATLKYALGDNRGGLNPKNRDPGVLTLLGNQDWDT